MNINNKKETGDYMRSILLELQNRLLILETEAKQYSRIPRFVRGINLQFWRQRRAVRSYTEKIVKYMENGWIE